ncbi:MAG: hypothetical protein HQK84_05855 [Nitrospinae bacterium]|nr:hypothetical protein [Nitrospinota bacterium]
MTSSDLDKKKFEELQAAFIEFSQSTDLLQQSYDTLRNEASKLNKELEESNKSLKESLGEQEKLRTFLEKIIQNIPGGVLVIDKDDKPMVWNEYYTKLMEECDVESIFHLMTEKTGTISIEDKNITLNYKISPYYRISNFNKSYKVVFIEDISSVTEMEEKLKRKERLASMGEMAAGIAHEIRNPLGGIKLFTSMLDKEVKENQDLHEMTQHITKGVNNIESIIKNMLFFAKEPEPILSVFPLNRLILEVIKFYLDSSIYKNITFEMHDEEDIIISADKELIVQALHNLLLNAIQVSQDDAPVKVSLKMVNKNMVEINVSDKGCGIPESELKKIFNPFFTTKARGTGLGMTIINTIMDAHNGDIKVSSIVGKGTDIKLYFPVD